MRKNIAVIPGDGIGPEIISESVKVLNAIAEVYGHEFDYHYGLMGAVAIEETGNPLPEETLRICRESDAILFGAIGDPKYDNDPTAKVRPEQGLLALRKELGLFSNIRPVKAYMSLYHLSPLKEKQLTDVDFVIYRELTGGIYFGKKGEDEGSNAAYDVSQYTRDEIERIAEQAFKAALGRKKKLMLVDKANVLATSRLWRSVVSEIKGHYPEVALCFMYVDNAAMQLMLNPRQFDVVLTENMFGDILSDEASVIPGSIGLLPSASLGEETALFEPIHGSYPQAAGKDIANPFGSILSAAMMLEYLDLTAESVKVNEAVDFALEHGFVSKDLDPVNFYFASTLGDIVSDFIRGDFDETRCKRENIELRKSTII